MEIAVNYEYREADVRNALDVEALATFVINTEEKPDEVVPFRGEDAEADGGRVTVKLPALSWNVIRLAPAK